MRTIDIYKPPPFVPKRKYHDSLLLDEKEARERHEAALAKQKANAEGKEAKAELIAESKKVCYCI